jgi:formate hydrogenlyase subunit 3/multisubunit Na+/H+ antiporter MnhD subunit
MEIIITFNIIVLVSLLFIPFGGARWKGIITITSVSLNTLLSSILAVQTLIGTNVEVILPGSLVTGAIPVRIDALSGWFILIINFTFVTGAFYGYNYLKVYRTQTANLSLHGISYILVHAALVSICVLQNSLAFLIAWEIMALASFILIIFEHYRQDTLKAGINFLIQSHICILLLMLGFMWVALKKNSYDFTAITAFSIEQPMAINFSLLLVFFIAFSIKAGFVPFHTWLPYAHPAAPAHVSGVMSGVIIKIGIFGILRMLLLIKNDYLSIGYVILIFSVVSGVYGVMLATLQHNLKKLLAYHSIENIGIIGIGIGLGCIGIGTGNIMLSSLGFAGALLHTLNHSLFKSLLFYAAGNVYQATHTMNIEHLGGIIKLMPKTSVVFLISALAICGLPPFNGFISEFLIYSGMLAGFKGAELTLVWIMVFSLFGLVLIGGLAIMCFTKAFGTVFLGNPRHQLHSPPVEAETGSLIAMYAGLLLIIGIGIFPKYFISALAQPLGLFANKIGPGIQNQAMLSFEALNWIGLCAMGMALLATVIFFIRKKVTQNKPKSINATWGCAYIAPSSKMQYTASSFVRTYRKLAEPMLTITKKKEDIKGVFPVNGRHETHPYDKAEAWLIDIPLRQLQFFINRFSFLQNGYLQVYIIYGVVFITMVLMIPAVYDKIIALVQFFNQL